MAHPPTVLVTGATGFTGGALARELVRRGTRVRALVRNLGTASALALAGFGVDLAEGDIRDAGAVARASEGVGVTYHIAATFGAPDHDERYCFDVNEGGTVNVIDGAKKHGVSRVVHCSTYAVHGNVRDFPITEHSPLDPGDVYQVSKLAGETRMQEAMAAGLPGVIFRPAGMYGPGDFRYLRVFRRIQNGDFPMFGSGEVPYQFTYIDDLVAGIILCGEHSAALGGLFLLCADGWITLNDFLRMVADTVGGTVPRIHWPIGLLAAAKRVCDAVCAPLGLDAPVNKARWEFYTKPRAFSNAKARALLGFEPRVGVADGITRTAQWYAARNLIGPVPVRGDEPA